MSPKYRKALYAFTALGTPVVAYLQLKGYIGDAELALWGAEVTVVSGLAAFKTPNFKKGGLVSPHVKVQTNVDGEVIHNSLAKFRRETGR